MAVATNLTEAEKQEKSAAKWEGGWKIGLSITAAPFIAIGATALTAVSLGVSAITKTLELGARLVLPKGWGQDTLQKWSKQSRSVAANSFFTAISYTVPIIPFVEGIYNMRTGRRDDFGMAAVGRWAARGLSGGWFGGTGIPQTDFEEFKQQQALKEQQQGLEMQPQVQQDQTLGQNQSRERRQSPPTLDVAVEEIKAAPNYAKAQEAYNKSLASPQAKKFDVVKGYPKKDGENTIIVFDHPEHKGDRDHQVTYTIGKDGKPISITSGEKATCVLPPIQKGPGEGFEMVRLENGKQKTVHDTAPTIQNDVIKAAKAEVVIAKPKVAGLESTPTTTTPITPDARTTAQKKQGSGMAIGGNDSKSKSKKGDALSSDPRMLARL